MYEKFTDRARKVMQLANQAAQRLNHEYIGTEHILLGLLNEGSGVAANALRNLNLDPDHVRKEVEKIIQSGPDILAIGKLPQTPRAKHAIQLAMEEARTIGHTYVGTEHILLGLIREEEGVAAQVLKNCGLTFDAIKVEVMTLSGPKRPRPAVESNLPDTAASEATETTAPCAAFPAVDLDPRDAELHSVWQEVHRLRAALGAAESEVTHLKASLAARRELIRDYVEVIHEQKKLAASYRSEIGRLQSVIDTNKDALGKVVTDFATIAASLAGSK